MTSHLARMAVDEQRKLESKKTYTTESGKGVRTINSLFDACMEIFGDRTNNRSKHDESQKGDVNETWH